MAHQNDKVTKVGLYMTYTEMNLIGLDASIPVH